MTDRIPERTLILDEAYRLLDRSGGAALQVTEILANTGLATRAFYRNFQTRDELLLVMFRRDRDLVLTQLRTAVAEATDPVDALRRWVTLMFEMLAEPRRKRRILTFSSEEMRRTRGYAEELRRFTAAEEALLAQIISDGRFRGYFPDADPGPDARSIRGAIEAGFTEQAHQPTGGDPKETAEQVLAFALRGLGAVTPSADHAAPEGYPSSRPSP